MPGLAASSSIFERIQLPKETFEIYLLDWVLPEKQALKLCQTMAEAKHEQWRFIWWYFGSRNGAISQS
jgi:DNA-binding response OmpR family regulator